VKQPLRQCWFGIIFFIIPFDLGIYNEDTTFFDTSRACVLDDILKKNQFSFRSIDHVQEFAYLVKNYSSINMVHNGIDPNNILCVQRFSHLIHPPNINI
jgi:hypothetical protein